MILDVLKTLADPQVVALRIRGAQWPRSLLRGTLIPDAWMALVQRPDGRRRFVPSGEDPAPDREDTLVLVRNRAITVPVAPAVGRSADNHEVHADVELLVRWMPRDDELAALHRTLLDEDTLTLARLAQRIAEAGATAGVRRFLAARPAARLVDEDVREPLQAQLAADLEKFLFDCGLVLERLGRVACASPTYQAQAALERQTARRAQEVAARAALEAAARTATRRRLDDLGEILGKLKAEAAAAGSLRWRELLPVLSPGERGRLLESLWRLTPDRNVAAAIVTVAGSECAWFDPAAPGQVAARLALPPDLGGLRSVTYDRQRDWLLVGAATGVWAVHATTRAIERRWPVPDAPPPTSGFNAAAIAGDTLIATHSQLGAWQWPLGIPGTPRALLRPEGGRPKTIRAVRTAEGEHVLLAADDEVRVFGPDGTAVRSLSVGRGSVHDVAVLGRTVYVATSEGFVLEDDWQSPNIWQVRYRGGQSIETVHARTWDDLVELVIPAGADGVLAIYGDEGVTARLLAAAVPVRRAWACDDLILGVNTLRDRLLVLSATAAERRPVEVPAARLLGHTLQDACIVTRPAAA